MSLTRVEAFHSPADASSVVELLQKYEDSALIIAGGTFLHGLASRGLLSGIDAVVDIGNLGLDAIVVESDNMVIGATTRLAQLEANGDVQEQPWLGAVKDALGYPPVQVMNAGTVGGSIASACPLFDLPTAFLSLDGVVRAQGPAGGRNLPLEEFFSGLFENSLDTAEFVTAIRLPQPPENSVSAFIKLETNANDLAILNAAVSLIMDEGSRCRQARVFIGGGAGETPARAGAAENLLAGAVLDENVITGAAEAAKSDTDPISDHRASAEYRSAMAKALVEKALHKALSRLGEEK